ncbi:hypothetical protein BVG16_24200 [Paenibacillus selenitireducens]|uniref:Glycogen debranching protein n=1 Tax=Paenibacillus selenitireducens TaxID=1324314 RepID=A0A1T2X3S9_9BACL|nr:hypothetical protein [Paenibacillus selenitireducens]OPA74233.1 hypothetical protein BVG16_24200 [Paenibacillus selenitireducens]
MNMQEWHKLIFTSGRDYYMVGNAQVTGVVQIDNSGPGSPVTFFVQDPHYFKEAQAKDYSYLFSQEEGLEPSVLTVAVDGREFRAVTSNIRPRWRRDGSSIVDVTWWAGPVRVTETYFASISEPIVYRQIRLHNKGDFSCRVKCSTRFTPNPHHFNRSETLLDQRGYVAVGEKFQIGLIGVEGSGEKPVLESGEQSVIGYEWNELYPGTSATAAFGYIFLDRTDIDYEVYEKLSQQDVKSEERAVEKKRAEGIVITSEHSDANHVYQSAVRGINICSSDRGRVNVGIWQYSMEWTRDASFAAIGAIHSGLYSEARAIFERLVNHLVDDQGRTILYNQFAPEHLEQFDQSGQLLFGLGLYYNWTKDADFIRKSWPKIEALANRLCTSVCKDPETGLFHNVRDFWERMEMHGIEEGYELAYQMWPVIGLRSTESLVQAVGTDEARARVSRWLEESERIWNNVLHHPVYSFIVDGKLTKRKGLDGSVQDVVKPTVKLPDDIPLGNDRISRLNPDTVTTLSVVYGLIDPAGTVPKQTVDSMESLWNMRWETGGYDRYHTSSEPDTPGPWGFASMFVARANLATREYERALRTISWFAHNQGGNGGVWHEYVPIIRTNAPRSGPVVWIWSEMTMFFVRDVLGIKPGPFEVEIRPNVPPQMGKVTAQVPIRGSRLTLELNGNEPDADRIRIDEGEWIRLADVQYTLQL